MNYLFKRSILPIMILLLVGLVPAKAAVYYVHQGSFKANDANPGTEALPWKTLKKACNAAKAGDTVIVKEGFYSDLEASPNYPYPSFNPLNNGTAGKYITFKSVPQHAAVIRPKDYPDNYYQAWGLKDKQYIEIDGFVIEGGIRLYHSNHIILKNIELTRGFFHDPSLNWGIALEHASYCHISNNYVHDMLDSGNHLHNTACIMVFGNSDYNYIEHNTADGNGKIIYSAFGQKAGQMDHNIWRYNIARNSTCGFLGMGSTDGQQVSTYNKFYQNLIINCTSAFELDHGSQYFEIYNNSAYNCENFIKIIKNNNTDIKLWNNISVGTEKAIRYQGYPDPSAFSTVLSFCDYNNFFGYQLFAFREVSPTLYYHSLAEWTNATDFDFHSLSSDPKYFEPLSEDFHLASSSPCLNAGVDKQDSDNDGIVNEHINMGCYITGTETIGVVANSSQNPPGAPVLHIVE